MTEQDLIDLGFEREEAYSNDEKFHYYKLGELLTNDNVEAEKNGFWTVTLYGEVYDYEFKDVAKVAVLVTLLEEHKKESGFDINNFNL